MKRLKEILPLGSPRLWSALAAVVSVAICATMVLLHFQEEQLIKHSARIVNEVRQARGKLADGYLHVSLAGDAAQAQDPANGLAQVDEALAQLTRIVSTVDPSEPMEAAARAARADFPRRARVFRELIGQPLAQQKPTDQRIAYRAVLEGVALIEASSQRELSGLGDRIDRQFFLAFGFAVVVLGAGTAGVYVVTRLKARAMAELEANEQRLILFVENAPAALAMLDREMRYVVASRRWRTDYNLGDQLLAGRSHYEIFPEIGEGWKRVHRQALAGEVLRDECDRFEREDGSVQWLRWEVRPWQTASGAIGGIVIFSEDITVRREAEDMRRQLAAIVESSDDAIIGKTLDGRVTSWNRAAERLFGYTAAEMIGQPLILLFPPERGGEEAEILAQIARGERIEHFETERVTKEGRRLEVAVTISPIRDADGRVVGASKVVRDVTERNRNVRALRESEEQFRTLVALAPEALFINLEGRVVYMNQRGLELWRAEKAEQIIGRNPFELFHPSFHELMRTRIQSLRDGAAIAPWREMQIVTTDGAALPVETSAAIFSYGGRRAVQVLVRDLRERKRAEEALRLSEMKFARAFANNPAAIALSRLEDGLALDVNDTWVALTGYSREEAVGRVIRGVWRRPESARRFVHELRTTGSVRAWEEPFIRKNGEVFVAQLSAQRLTLNGEEVILSTLVDMTARKRAEEAREQERRRVVLLAEISRQLVATDDPQTVLKGIFESVAAELAIDIYANYLVRPDGAMLRLKNAGGLTEKQVEDFTDLPMGVSLCGLVAQRREALAFADLPAATEPQAAGIIALGVKAYAGFPLVADGKLIGTASFGVRSRSAYTPEELQLLEAVTDQISAAMERARLLGELRASEHRHRSLFDTMAQGVVYHDAAGRVVAMNAAGVRILGLTLAELTSLTAEELGRRAFRGDGREFPAEEHPARQALREGRKVHEVEMGWHNAREGRRRWLSVDAVPQFAGGSARPTGVFATFDDITERRAAEEALRRSEQRLRALGDNLPESYVYQYTRSAAGAPRFIFLSAGVARLHQVTAEQAMADFGLVQAQLDAQQLEVFLLAEQQSARTLQDFLVELRHTRPDGQERWIQLRSRPQRAADGTVVWDGVATDVTERKKVVEALAANKAKLDAALASMTDAVFIADREGWFVEFNEAFAVFHKFPSKEACARRFADYTELLELRLLSGEEVPLSQWAVPRALAGERGIGVEYRVRRRDTGETWVGSYSFAPIRGSGGEITGAVVTARDVTEAKQAQEALRESEARFAHAFAESPTPLIITRREDARLIDANAAFLKMFKLEREQAIGRNAVELGLIDPVTFSGARAVLLRDLRVSNWDSKMFTSRGEPLEVLVSSQGIELAGAPCSLTTLVDITERKRAEEALRFNQSLLNEMGRIASVGGWYLDVATGVGHWTEEVARLHDLPVDAAASKDFGFQFYPGAARQQIEAAVEAAATRGESYDLELPFVSATGRKKWVRTIGHAVFAEGKVVQLIGSIQDITAQRQAAEALQAERDRLEKIAATSPSVIHSFRELPDGRFCFPYVSPAIRAIYGVDPEALAEDAAVVVPLWHPDDVPGLLADIAASKAQMTPWQGEFRVRNPERGMIWVAGHSMPVAEADGSVTWHGTLTEVTERKLAERRTATQAAVSRVLAEAQTLDEAAPQLVRAICEGEDWQFGAFWTVDEVARCLRCEAVWTEPALELSELVSVTHRSTFGPDEGLPGRVWHTKSTWLIPEVEKEERYLRRGVAVRFGLHSALGFPVLIGGEVVGVVDFLASEIHERDERLMAMFETIGRQIGLFLQRRLAEEQVRALNAELEERVRARTTELEMANKELEAFSYSVSHDLRAPLRTVNGFSEILIEDHAKELSAEARHYLENIATGAQQMGVLIDDLLTFSRLSRLPLTRTEIDTNWLVSGVLQDLAPQREGRKLEIRCGLLPPSLGDQALLRQVWINLLGNAVKYTRHTPEAWVEISAETTEAGVVFQVRDNGAGFDMRYADKLFGVFQRLHRADEYEGTGVGLAIVQRIVHRHGGRVWAQAEVGRGAIFSFTLEHPPA